MFAVAIENVGKARDPGGFLCDVSIDSRKLGRQESYARDGIRVWFSVIVTVEDLLDFFEILQRFLEVIHVSPFPYAAPSGADS